MRSYIISVYYSRVSLFLLWDLCCAAQLRYGLLLLTFDAFTYSSAEPKVYQLVNYRSRPLRRRGRRYRELCLGYYLGTSASREAGEVVTSTKRNLELFSRSGTIAGRSL